MSRMSSRASAETIQVPRAYQDILVAPSSGPLFQPEFSWENTARVAGVFVSVREAATRLGVHENTIRNWVDRGLLRAVRLPGSGYRRIDVAGVERIRRGILGNLAPGTVGPSVELPSDY